MVVGIGWDNACARAQPGTKQAMRTPSFPPSSTFRNFFSHSRHSASTHLPRVSLPGLPLFPDGIPLLPPPPCPSDCNLQLALAPIRELSSQRVVCTQHVPFRVAWPPSQREKELLLEGLQGYSTPTHTGPSPHLCSSPPWGHVCSYVCCLCEISRFHASAFSALCCL